MKRKVALAAAPGALAVPTASDAAHAAVDGDFFTYLSGVINGFESRTWSDSNKNTNSGAIRFQGCTSNPDVGVYREITAWPDDEEGRGIIWCLGPSDGPVGNLSYSNSAGNFHFTIKETRGNGFLTVGNVHVIY